MATGPRAVQGRRDVARSTWLESFRAAARRHPILTDLAAAYAVSWAYWIWMAAVGWVSSPGGTQTHFPGLLGPAIGAVIATWLIGGETGLRELVTRALRWRLPLRWYAVAALPFVFFLVGVALQVATGAAAPTIDDLARFSGLPEIGLPAVVLLALLVNCFGEEIGWRGFATPTLLRRHGFITTSLLVAAMWATWHLPSVPVIENYRAMGWAVVPMLLFGLGSGAFVFTWLWTRTESVLIAALFHLAINLGSATDAARGIGGAAATTGIMIWAAWLIVTELRRPGETRVGNRPLVSLLRSPLGRWFGGIAVLTYCGRSSGRTLSTPMEVIADGDGYLVYVAAAPRKQWWRNVRADPAVQILRAGAVRPARATVLDDGGPEAQAALARYLRARPNVARGLGFTGDPLEGQRLAEAAAASVLVRISPTASA
jgi:deazaflavin-dependent oxidoreductase (nitroreductase family)